MDNAASQKYLKPWKLHPHLYEKVSELESVMEVSFRNRELLFEALTHKSIVQKNTTSDSQHNMEYPWNERLEFLGDSVLNFLTTKIIYAQYPQFSEGQLTNLRATVVSSSSLTEIANTIGLSRFIALGSGEFRMGGRERQKLQADTLEAVIGAVFLDRGLDYAEKFFVKFFSEPIQRRATSEEVFDFKTTFQEVIQGLYRIAPTYRLVSAQGPEHSKVFVIAVEVKGKEWGRGEGLSKKQAAQEAAKEALKLYESKKPRDSEL